MTTLLNQATNKATSAPLQLTDEQRYAVNTILAWLADPASPQEFRLGGYAGTGKTTVLKFLINEAKTSIIVCAFTGKACHVLNKKGCYARTLHATMYHAEQLPNGTFIFEKRDNLEGNPRLVIVDEASMISTELYNDLKSFKTKILFVGDPGQLEPVGDNPNLMSKPDIVLQTIQRQAAHSPIIRLANTIRNGGIFPNVSVPGLNMRIKQKPTNEALATADIVLCARNATRQRLNDTIRTHLGRASNTLVIDDKIICLRNNQQYAVFNGMIFWVRKIEKETPEAWHCVVEDELGNTRKDLPIWRRRFEDANIDKEIKAGRIKYPKNAIECTYGNAITVHKSQGSEWDKVVVIDEWVPPVLWDMRRWRYTAITRAAKELTYFI